MRGIKLCIILVVIAFLFSFYAFATSEEAKKHYETAKSLYVAGDTKGAIAELEKALAIDPNYEQAKKLYEKLGGGKEDKETVKASKGESQTSQQIQMVSSVIDRETLRSGIALVLSNSVGQMRSEIFGLINDSIRESFDEILKSASRNEVKSVLKQAIFEVMKEVLKEEISYSISVIKDEVGLSNSSGGSSTILNIKAKSEGLATTSASDNKAKARELYEKAMRLLDDENYSSAKELLIEASRLDPENQDIKRALDRIPSK